MQSQEIEVKVIFKVPSGKLFKETHVSCHSFCIEELQIQTDADKRIDRQTSNRQSYPYTLLY